MKEEEYQLQDLGDTETLAKTVAADLKSGTTLGLIGELGAGKTTFVRFLVGALGGDPEHTSSPSYVLCNEYECTVQSQLLTVEHWDLYRVSELPEELWEPPSDAVLRVVEWADKFQPFLESCDRRLSFLVAGDGSRRTSLQRVRH